MVQNSQYKQCRVQQCVKVYENHEQDGGNSLIFDIAPFPPIMFKGALKKVSGQLSWSI